MRTNLVRSLAMLMLSGMSLGALAGCQSLPGRDLAEAVRQEPALYAVDTDRQYQERFLALGSDVVPVILEEIQRDGPSPSGRGIVRVSFYLNLLRRMRARDARPAVEDLLARSDQEDVQFEALQALEVLGDHRSCPALRVALRSRHSEVRGKAAAMLAQFFCDDAIPELIALLEDPDQDMRDAARGALLQLANESHGDDSDSWRAWWEERRRRRLATP